MAASKIKINEYLKHLFLFKDLPDYAIDQLASSCHLKNVLKNEILFTQGSKADAFYFVVFGKLVIYRSSNDGDEQTLHIHEDGDVVAEAAMYDDVCYPANCKAIKETLVLTVPKHGFQDLLKSNPEMACKILSAYAKRLRHFVSMVEYLSLDDVRKRVLKYFQKNSRKDGDVYIMSLTISKKEMAGFLGMTPETFSRVLKKLKEQKIIHENKDQIIIESFEEL